jgi:glycosyltransferase involved in cell wall biosynthesis
VLVPVFRVERYVERCARSVLEQTYQNIEYIFVDDATDDASIIILERIILDYPDRQDRVRIIRHQSNRGLAAARNTAVDVSHGDFIFHVDSDDWIDNDAIELMVRKQQATNADIVTAEAFNDKNGIVTRHLTSGWNLDKTSLLKGILTYKVSTSIWRRLIRKSLYTENKIMCDERGCLGEDFQVLPKLVYYAKVVAGIENPIYHYNTINKWSIMTNVHNSLEIQKQGLVSAESISSFFSDKERIYKDCVSGICVKYMHIRMIQNVRNCNKQFYYYFSNQIKNANPEQWKYIRWDNPYVRYVESHYLSLLLQLYFKRLFQKLKAII